MILRFDKIVGKEKCKFYAKLVKKNNILDFQNYEM